MSRVAPVLGAAMGARRLAKVDVMDRFSGCIVLQRAPLRDRGGVTGIKAHPPARRSTKGGAR